MNHRDPLQEAIDACRPGSDDLGLPEMEELADLIGRDPQVLERYERSQRLDRAIAAAMGDTPPAAEGLEARLLAALAACEPDSADGQQGGVVQREKADRSRRLWRWAASLSAAAAVVAVSAAALLWWLPEPSLERALVADAADAWVDQLLQSELAWSRVLDDAQLAEYPSSASLRSPPAAWLRMETAVTQASSTVMLDRRAVVYDLRHNQGELRAVLFVIRPAAHVQAPNLAPRTPTRVTGGWSIGVWREGEVLYVLAVEGDQSRYRSLVKPLPKLA